MAETLNGAAQVLHTSDRADLYAELISLCYLVPSLFASHLTDRQRKFAIVIDGLDESGRDGSSAAFSDLISLLTHSIGQLPAAFGVLVTSRFEVWMPYPSFLSIRID